MKALDFEYPAFLVDEIPEAVQLPPEIAAALDTAMREGVYFKRPIRGKGTKSIGWRSDTPNALARAIINNVHDRQELELDGHKYWIEPQ